MYLMLITKGRKKGEREKERGKRLAAGGAKGWPEWGRGPARAKLLRSLVLPNGILGGGNAPLAQF